MRYSNKPVGWRGESHRHYLASKGISTKPKPYFDKRYTTEEFAEEQNERRRLSIRDIQNFAQGEEEKEILEEVYSPLEKSKMSGYRGIEEIPMNKYVEERLRAYDKYVYGIDHEEIAVDILEKEWYLKYSAHLREKVRNAEGLEKADIQRRLDALDKSFLGK